MRKRRGRQRASWTNQLPWFQDERSYLPQGLLTSISLLDSEFNGLWWSYRCKVLQAPRQMLGYSSWVFPRYLLKRVCPVLSSCLPWYLYRACALPSINLTWEPESPLDDNPAFIESVGNFQKEVAQAQLSQPAKMLTPFGYPLSNQLLCHLNSTNYKTTVDQWWSK